MMDEDDDRTLQSMADEGCALAIAGALDTTATAEQLREAASIVRQARAQMRERARLAYDAHSFEGTGGPCKKCGLNIRNAVHLRIGETREARIRTLDGDDQ